MNPEREEIVQPSGSSSEEPRQDRPEPGPPAPPAEGRSTPEKAETPGDSAAALETIRAEKQELYDRLLRKQAELENIRKRLQREKEEFLHSANADLTRLLLPTLDAFERALEHRNSSVPEEFYQGIELIYRGLSDALTRAGLSPVDSLGKIFDPHLHQAAETVEAAGYRDHEIVEELERGYRFRNRLLRPAIVKVAVAPRPEEPQPSAVHSPPSE